MINNAKSKEKLYVYVGSCFMTKVFFEFSYKRNQKVVWL